MNIAEIIDVQADKHMKACVKLRGSDLYGPWSSLPFLSLLH